MVLSRTVSERVPETDEGGLQCSSTLVQLDGGLLVPLSSPHQILPALDGLVHCSLRRGYTPQHVPQHSHPFSHPSHSHAAFSRRESLHNYTSRAACVSTNILLINSRPCPPHTHCNVKELLWTCASSHWATQAASAGIATLIPWAPAPCSKQATRHKPSKQNKNIRR